MIIKIINELATCERHWWQVPFQPKTSAVCNGEAKEGYRYTKRIWL